MDVYFRNKDLVIYDNLDELVFSLEEDDIIIDVEIFDPIDNAFLTQYYRVPKHYILELLDN